MSTTTTSNYISQINVDFPIAGIDNDSQGFRNNFSNISNALSSANADIANLQLNAVLTNQPNNFSDNIIKQAQFQDCSVTAYDGTVTPVTGIIEIDYSFGSRQRYVVSGDINTTSFINVINLPGTNQSGTLILEVTAATQSTNLSFNNSTNISSSPSPFVISTSTTSIFELSTNSSGQLFVKKLNENDYVFSSSLSIDGFQLLPSGLTLQWGSATTTAGTTGTIVFPQPFTTAVFNVTGNLGAASGANGYVVRFPNMLSTTQFTYSWDTMVAVGTGTTATLYWSAIGN